MSKSEVEAVLSIGDLAERTGVSAATLRVWESRHGFPVPHRRESGHRRYDDEHVRVIRDVVRRRDTGVRLDVAIEQAVAAQRPTPTAPGAPSVYARLRHTHPALTPQKLTKATLLALSWAIEDEFASRAQHAHLFGAFQRVRNFESANPRWSDLARTMEATFVFADFDVATTRRPLPPGRPIPVPLPPDHPMSREWAVVCDADELPVALTAWELPGQHAVPDRDRVFESVWTVERDAVRQAARVCADVAVDLGVQAADGVAEQLSRPLGPGTTDLAQVTSLFNRVVAYVDARVVGRT
ncbi:DICT sensory domain-containing protein [Nocardioides plantarum]|uniref:DICT sensory domain-containing protein n=1 Tax=Nocardioides plantarum TaxID=29299 RepID=A0ABV5K6B3_9ACTN|nr:DICT sensory domain-containing protein [Nocardioides plantarum]